VGPGPRRGREDDVTEDRKEDRPADVPPVEEDAPLRDANLEEQTVHGQEAGPGASKMVNIDRMAKHVRTQKERSRPDSAPEDDTEGNE
jgi:hypothetical protein